MVERRSISDLGPHTISETGIRNEDYSPVAVMPAMKVVKLGGQSLLDRGRSAVFPVLDEIIALRKKKPAERSEEEAMLDLYMQALGMLPE